MFGFRENGELTRRTEEKEKWWMTPSEKQPCEDLLCTWVDSASLVTASSSRQGETLRGSKYPHSIFTGRNAEPSEVGRRTGSHAMMF
jgi:hypothetical protein